MKTAKFLGINLDDSLKWDTQVEHIINKIHSGLYALNQTKKLLDVKHKITLYYAIVHSHLQYGISIWGSLLSSKNLKRLQVAQNKCMRQIFEYKYKESVREIMRKNLIPRVDELVKIEICKLMYRIMNDYTSKRISNKVL